LHEFKSTNILLHY